MKVTIIQEEGRVVGVVSGYVSEEHDRIRHEIKKAQESSESPNQQGSPAPRCATPMPGPDQLFFELEVPDKVQKLAHDLLGDELDKCLREAKAQPCNYAPLF